eukprot:1500082-Amphidinium_carterae.1
MRKLRAKTNALITMYKLRQHACTVFAALASGNSDLEQAVAKSALNSTYMTHILVRLAANNWSPTPKSL